MITALHTAMIAESAGDTWLDDEKSNSTNFHMIVILQN
jgi:hypothetical protein